MDQRGQFTFYRSFYDALKAIPKKDREPALMAICAYALDGELPVLDGTPGVVFTLIKPTLDTGRNKAANRLNKIKTNENKSKTNGKQTVKEKEKEKEKEGEREGEKEREIENDSYISLPTLSFAEKKTKSPLDVALDDFAVFRKAMKKPLTPKARELTIRELEKLAPGDEAMQIAIINQSIQRGWQGVFPLKDDNPKPAKYRLQMPDYDSMEDLPV